MDFQVRFWRYSLPDLGRIIAPLVMGVAVLGIPGAITGFVVGIGFAELKIQGKTVDQVLASYVKYQVGRSQLDTDAEVREQVVVLDDGTVAGFVEVDSVDLDMASERDWQVNLDTVAELYKGLEEPLEIHSRKRRIDLSDYRCIRDEAVTTDHFIVVKEFSESDSELDEAVDDVVERCRVIRNSLNAGDLSTMHVTGDRLEGVVDRFNPSEISFSSSRYTVDDTSHRRLLYISKYPEERGPGLLSDLLNLDTPGFIDVVQTVEPVSDKQRKKLNRLIGRMRAESIATPDRLRGSMIDRKLSDAQNLIEVEEAGDQRLVNTGVYLVIRGSSGEEVDSTADEVKRLLRRFSVEYEEPWLETPQSVQTDLPIRPDRLNKDMMMPSRSAASNFSFSTHDKFEENGISFGIDSRNGMPVILDRYCWEASHVVRMGKIGSGKSYFAKLSVYRSWQTYDNLQVYVIDPKQEYGGLIDALDGETVVLDNVDLTEIETGSATRYTVADRSRDNTELLTESVRHVYRKASKDTDPTIVLLDEAHRLLSHSAGRTTLGELVREGRDRNISVEMITQNASDFTRSQEGRDILKNVNCYIFMQHQDVDTGVSDFFNLSQREAVELRRLRTGTELPFSEGVIRGPVNTKLRIEATEQEHEVVTAEKNESFEIETMSDADQSSSTEPKQNQSADKGSLETSETDGGAVLTSPPNLDDSSPDQEPAAFTVGRREKRREGGSETFMELPDTCVTHDEKPRVKAPAEELLPELLPGWEVLKSDTDRWQLPVSEDYVNATYLDPSGDRYMVHISRWKPGHVRYAIEELYGKGHPTWFDIWIGRGRYVFGVKIADGYDSQAKTLLAASPALSKAYLRQ